MKLNWPDHMRKMQVVGLTPATVAGAAQILNAS